MRQALQFAKRAADRAAQTVAKQPASGVCAKVCRVSENCSNRKSGARAFLVDERVRCALQQQQKQQQNNDIANAMNRCDVCVMRRAPASAARVSLFTEQRKSRNKSHAKKKKKSAYMNDTRSLSSQLK
jgi:hypothetical protein